MQLITTAFCQVKRMCAAWDERVHFLDDRTADELYYLVLGQSAFGFVLAPEVGRTEDGDEVAGLRLTCALVISPGWNTTAAA